MGVLRCERRDCENIMCDHIIDDMYICNECLDEFRTLDDPKLNTRAKILKKFREFMDISKGEFDYREITLKDWIDEHVE